MFLLLTIFNKIWKSNIEFDSKIRLNSKYTTMLFVYQNN